MHFVPIPPSLIFVDKTLYAMQGDIYALDARSGTLRQRYGMQGFANCAVVNDVLSINVSKHPSYLVQAVRGADGTLLWSYQVKERLSAAPVVADGVVYVSVVEGFIYALQATDGKLLWLYKVDVGVDVPAYLGPIISTSPTVAGNGVYIAPGANDPLEPFVYALDAKSGKLLWKAQIPESSSFPLTVIDNVMYVSTFSQCLALRTSDGVALWRENLPAHPCSSPVVVQGAVYISLHHVQGTALLYALHAANGSFLWQYKLDTVSANGFSGVPAVAEGDICICSSPGYLTAVQATTGTLLWKKEMGDTWLSSPVVAEGMVYVGTSNGSVLAFRVSDGEQLWQTSVDTPLTMGYSISLES